MHFYEFLSDETVWSVLYKHAFKTDFLTTDSSELYRREGTSLCAINSCHLPSPYQQEYFYRLIRKKQLRAPLKQRSWPISIDNRNICICLKSLYLYQVSTENSKIAMKIYNLRNLNDKPVIISAQKYFPNASMRPGFVFESAFNESLGVMAVVSGGECFLATACETLSDFLYLDCNLKYKSYTLDVPPDVVLKHITWVNEYELFFLYESKNRQQIIFCINFIESKNSEHFLTLEKQLNVIELVKAPFSDEIQIVHSGGILSVPTGSFKCDASQTPINSFYKLGRHLAVINSKSILNFKTGEIDTKPEALKFITNLYSDRFFSGTEINSDQPQQKSVCIYEISSRYNLESVTLTMTKSFTCPGTLLHKISDYLLCILW